MVSGLHDHFYLYSIRGDECNMVERHLHAVHTQNVCGTGLFTTPITLILALDRAVISNKQCTHEYHTVKEIHSVSECHNKLHCNADNHRLLVI